MPFKSALIIDDDNAEGTRLAALAQRCGFATTLVSSGEDALALLKGPAGKTFDAVILDLVMPDLDGMSVLQSLRGRVGMPPIIVHATTGGIDTVPSAIRAGAIDFLIRPVGVERLNVALANAFRIRALEHDVRERAPGTDIPRLADLVSNGQAMQRVRELAVRAVKMPLPTLVVGPSGSGKRRLLRAIHGDSDRADRTLVTLNGATATLSDTTSALREALAQQTSLLVVHIDRLSGDAQSALAQGFEAGVLAFGTTLAATKKQARLYATCTRDLAASVREGTFRSDLYMRLAVQPISIPALYHRGDDVGALARHFLMRASCELGTLVREFSADALDMLHAHAWPGDVRELETLIYRATLLSRSSVIESVDLPALLPRAAMLADTSVGSPEASRLPEALPVVRPGTLTQLPPGLPAHAISMIDSAGGLRSLEAVEAFAIRHALVHCGGHIGRAATELGIGRSTLYRRARDLGLLQDLGLSQEFNAAIDRETASSARSSSPSVFAPAVPLGVVA